MIKYVEIVNCYTTETLAPTCGSEKTSCMLFTGPYGTDAPSKTSSHSARLFSPILRDVNTINSNLHTDYGLSYSTTLANQAPAYIGLTSNR